MDNQAKENLKKLLQKSKLMALSTIDESGKPWSSVVYRVFDDEFNIYFISDPETKHCQHILNNKNVSLAIFDSTQVVGDEKEGLQIQGVAKEVSIIERIKWFFKMFKEMDANVPEVLSFDNFKNKVLSSRVYKITPTKIQIFSEKLFPEDEIKIFEIN